LTQQKTPSFFDAMLPIAVLISLLAASLNLYGDNSSSGPNQIALLIATFTAVIVSIKNGFTWTLLEEAMKNADVFVGLSAKDVVNKEMVKSMSKNPIIFACANPDPEIKPELIKEVSTLALLKDSGASIIQGKILIIIVGVEKDRELLKVNEILPKYCNVNDEKEFQEFIKGNYKNSCHG